MKKLLFVLVVLLGCGVVSASEWVADPSDCPSEYQSQTCTGSDLVCGYSGGITYCYDMGAIDPPGANETGNVLRSGSFDGGFLLDCYAYDGSEPHCDNGGGLWCNRDADCYGVGRDTVCVKDVWETFDCGDCRSGYTFCDGSGVDVDGCEILKGVTSYPGEANAVYNVNGSCAASCKSDYCDSNGDLGVGGDGCEWLDDDACSVGGAAGNWSCGLGVCVPTKSYFETGTFVSYVVDLGVGAMFWFRNLGDGDLMNISSDAGSVVVDNSANFVTSGNVSGDSGIFDELYLKGGLVNSTWWFNQTVGLDFSFLDVNYTIGLNLAQYWVENSSTEWWFNQTLNLDYSGFYTDTDTNYTIGLNLAQYWVENSSTEWWFNQTLGLDYAGFYVDTDTNYTIGLNLAQYLNEGNFSLKTFDMWNAIWSVDTDVNYTVGLDLAQYLSTFNSTYDEWSYNQTLGLDYAGFYLDTGWVENSSTKWWVNQTVGLDFDYLDVNYTIGLDLAKYLDTFNSSYDGKVSSQWVNVSESNISFVGNASVSDTFSAVSGRFGWIGDAWSRVRRGWFDVVDTGSLNASNFTLDGFVVNRSVIVGKFNATYDEWAYNQTLGLDYAGFYNKDNSTVANYLVQNESNTSYSCSFWDGMDTPDDLGSFSVSGLIGADELYAGTTIDSDGFINAIKNVTAVKDVVAGQYLYDLNGVLDTSWLMNQSERSIDWVVLNYGSLIDNSFADDLHRHSELVASDGSPDPAVSVDAGGKVGIGTNSPSAKLHVQSTARAVAFDAGDVSTWSDGYITNPTDTINAAVGIRFQVDASVGTGNYGAGIAAVKAQTTGQSQHLVFITDPTDAAAPVERMRIEAGGNVGIGTENPAHILETKKTGSGDYVGMSLITDNIDSSISLRFAPSNAPSVRYAEIKAINSGSNNIDLAFITNVGATITEKMRILSGGNVGIGTISPSEPLEIEHASDARILLTNTGASDSYFAQIDSGGTIVMRNSAGSANIILRSYGDSYFSGGNFGIGVSNPHSKLEVNGAVSSETFTIVEDALNYDVSGINTLFLSPDKANLAITGFTGGVAGQVLYISATNVDYEITLVHSSGTQRVFLHAGEDETLTREYGGWTLTCDGTHWYEVGH